MSKRFCEKVFLVGCAFLASWVSSEICHAFTANRVWFEFLEDGRYRVSATYTIPEMKELRSFYVIFSDKKAANRYYWALVKGADFHPDRPELLNFVTPKLEPQPW